MAATDPLLAAVVALSDANAERLGHFPASCFEREAAAGKVLVAVGQHEELLGFLLYRVARNRAVIQQMCVASPHRGAGVGRLLTDALKVRTRNLDGIALHCAREFTDSTQAWRGLGFVAIDEKPGRGKDRRPLTRFWFDHRKDDLWSEGRAKVRGFWVATDVIALPGQDGVDRFEVRLEEDRCLPVWECLGKAACARAVGDYERCVLQCTKAASIMANSAALRPAFERVREEVEDMCGVGDAAGRERALKITDALMAGSHRGTESDASAAYSALRTVAEQLIDELRNRPST